MLNSEYKINKEGFLKVMEELAYQIKNGNGKIGEQGKILLKAELYPCYLDLKLEKICEVERKKS